MVTTVKQVDVANDKEVPGDLFMLNTTMGAVVVGIDQVAIIRVEGD